MARFCRILLCALLVVSLAACGQKSGTLPESGNTQIANPFVDCATLEDAARLAGFDITVPGQFDGYPNQVIQAVENSMIQVMYFDGDPEAESSMVMVRKGAGEDDISGDYNEYSEKETANLYGVDVQMRGENGLVYSAVWTWDGYSFAINADKGLSRDALAAAVEEMVTVIG